MSDYGNAFIFPVEHLKTRGPELLSDLGAFLDLPDAAGWAASIDPGQKANESEKFKASKRTELTEAEQLFIAEHPELEARYDAVAALARSSAVAQSR